MTTIRKLFAEYAAMAGIWIGLVILFGVLSEYFLTTRTLGMIANQIPPLTMLAVGMTFVLIIGGIDLSVGSVMGLSGAVVGLAMVDWSWSFYFALPLAVGVGALAGLAIGSLSAGIRIPSFIVSLGMLEIARGLAFMATDSQTKFIGERVEGLTTPIGGLGIAPAFFIAVTAVTVGQLTLGQTAFGRRILAIGANETAAHLAGIRTRIYKVIVFAISGACAGIAGVFFTSKFQSADPNAAVGMELSAIASVVVGGTSLMGGRGSVVNSFFGVLIIATLGSGLAQIGASEPSKRVITGAVIVAAVIMDACRGRWNPFRWWKRSSSEDNNT